MSYIKKELMPGEKVLHRARAPWSGYILPLSLAMAVVAAGVAFDQLTIAGAAAVLICLPWLIAFHLKRLKIEFTVTDRRIAIKAGLLRQSSSDILLRTIEDVRLEQGIFDRMLDRGTLVLTRTGGVQTALKNVWRPREFRRQLRIAMETGEQFRSEGVLRQGDVAA